MNYSIYSGLNISIRFFLIAHPLLMPAPAAYAPSSTSSSCLLNKEAAENTVILYVEQVFQ